MKREIERYLEYEKKVESPVVRGMLREKVMKYDDIAGEFMRWLRARKYDKEGLEIEGWTAQKIYERAPQLNGIGVFNFLVTLRDSPEEAKKYIDERFRIL